MVASETVKLEGGRRISEGSRAIAPLVTILVVIFRVPEQELRAILENVFSHDPVSFELIVVDGGSGHSTVELLKEWSDHIDLWVSEEDKGLYDAMNKGARLAEGHFLYHLNAGDRLTHLPVQELTLAREEGMDAASFPVLVDNERMFYPLCGVKLRFKNTLHHQGTFYRRAALPQYDLQYRLFADFDANQRMVQQGASVRIFDVTVAHHESGGLGDGPAGQAEQLHIVRKNHGPLFAWWSWFQSEWSGIRIRNTQRLKRMLGAAPMRATAE